VIMIIVKINFYYIKKLKCVKLLSIFLMRKNYLHSLTVICDSEQNISRATLGIPIEILLRKIFTNFSCCYNIDLYSVYLYSVWKIWRKI